MQPCHQDIRVISWGLNGLKGGNEAHDFTIRGVVRGWFKYQKAHKSTTHHSPFATTSHFHILLGPLPTPPPSPFSLDLFLFIFDPGLVCSSSPFNPSRCILWVINHQRVFRYSAAATDFPVNTSRGVDHICILQSAVVGVKSSPESWGRMAARAYWFKCQKVWLLHEVGTLLVQCDHSLTADSNLVKVLCFYHWNDSVNYVS